MSSTTHSPDQAAWIRGWAEAGTCPPYQKIAPAFNEEERLGSPQAADQEGRTEDSSAAEEARRSHDPPVTDQEGRMEGPSATDEARRSHDPPVTDQRGRIEDPSATDAARIIHGGDRHRRLPRLGWPGWLFKSILGILLILIVLKYKTVSSKSNVISHDIYEADCQWILSSMGSRIHFPLPSPVDVGAHQVVLQELGDPDMLSRLIHSHSRVNFTVTTMTEELSRLIPQVAQIYTRSLDEYTDIAYADDIFRFDEQLRIILSRLNQSLQIYQTLRTHYYTLNATTTAAFEKGQPSDLEELIVCLEPVILPQIGGFDGDKKYLDPWKEKFRRKEEARLGVIAWERETRRLRYMIQMILEMRRSLQYLNVSPSQRDTQIQSYGSIYDGPSGFWVQSWRSLWQEWREGKPELTRDSNDLRRGWFSLWFRRYVIGNDELDKQWMELFTSDKEQTHIIQIDPRWCERLET